MILAIVVLIILLTNWFFSELFGFFPIDLFHSLETLFWYGAIAVIIIVFSWGFGD